MKFYQVHDTVDGDAEFFATLKEAKSMARGMADHNGIDIPIDQVECAMDKASIINLANGRGWCISRKEVASIKPRKVRS